MGGGGGGGLISTLIIITEWEIAYLAVNDSFPRVVSHFLCHGIAYEQCDKRWHNVCIHISKGM